MPEKMNLPGDTVGARVRALRIAANMTQRKLAGNLNVSCSAVSQWETGRAGQACKNLEHAATALNTSVTYLVSGETGALAVDERALMRLYRACSVEDRRIVLQIARCLART